MERLMSVMVNINPVSTVLVFVGIIFLLLAYNQKRLKGTKVGVEFQHVVPKQKDPILYMKTQKQFVWAGTILVAVGIAMGAIL